MTMYGADRKECHLYVEGSGKEKPSRLTVT